MLENTLPLIHYNQKFLARALRPQVQIWQKLHFSIFKTPGTDPGGGWRKVQAHLVSLYKSPNYGSVSIRGKMCQKIHYLQVIMSQNFRLDLRACRVIIERPMD